MPPPPSRSITLHPDEAMLQEARAMEKTDYFRETYRQRVVVEHRIGRLVRLGMRQSRFFGRAKTQFQALMAAAVANFTLVAGWIPSEGGLCGLLRRVFATARLHGAFHGLGAPLRATHQMTGLPAAA